MSLSSYRAVLLTLRYAKEVLVILGVRDEVKITLYVEATSIRLGPTISDLNYRYS